MLEQNLAAMKLACTSLVAAPMQPSMQVLQSELDGARSLLSSMSAELVACCQPGSGAAVQTTAGEAHRIVALTIVVAAFET